jgi:hypothetical protein
MQIQEDPQYRKFRSNYSIKESISRANSAS